MGFEFEKEKRVYATKQGLEEEFLVTPVPAEDPNWKWPDDPQYWSEISISTIYPYVCVHDWTPGSATEPIIKKGDEGYLFATRESLRQLQAKVSINSKPDGSYAVPLRVINASQVKAGNFTIRGLGSIIPQPSLPSGILNEPTRLDALLCGILHGLRTQILSRLSLVMAIGIDSQSSNRCSLAKLWAMSEDEDYCTADDSGVYLRLYKMRNGQYQAYCSSSIQPYTRHKQHKQTFNREKPPKSHHYSSAKGYSECKIPVLVCLAPDAVILRTTEQDFHMIFQTYAFEALRVPWHMENPQDIDTAAGLQDIQARVPGKIISTDRLFAVAFDTIAKKVVSHIDYHGTCAQMSINPLNWSSPLAEMPSERTPWIKTVLFDRTRFRRGTSITLRRNGPSLNVFTGVGSFNISTLLHETAGVKESNVVHMTFEMMHNNEAHPRPWGSFSIIGGWSDWSQMRSLGIRIEWQNSAGAWFLAYLHRSGDNNAPTGIPNVATSYRKASAITAAFKNIEYINPEP